MSISAQVQNSISQDNLEAAAAKIDQAKDVVRSFMEMRESLESRENVGMLGEKIAGMKKAVEEKLAELNSSAVKMMELVDETVTTFKSLKAWHDWLDGEETAKPPLLNNLEEMANKLFSMDPEFFNCSWFILRKKALEDQVRICCFDRQFQPSLRRDADMAKELLQNNTALISREREQRVKLLLFKEKLRIFCRMVEANKVGNLDEITTEYHMLGKIYEEYLKVNKDKREFSVKARIISYKKKGNAMEQVCLYTALDQMVAEEEVVAVIVRHFSSPTYNEHKDWREGDEKLFYTQLNDRINNIMFTKLVEFCNDLESKISWMRDVPKTGTFGKGQPPIEGMFFKNRTDYHFKIATRSAARDQSVMSATTSTSEVTVTTVKTPTNHQMIVFYEFLLQNQYRSPVLDQQLIMLENCYNTLPKKQFEEAEVKFFQCLFPAFPFQKSECPP